MVKSAEAELTPAERSAATKKRRSRQRLLEAADKLIKRDGIDVSVDAIAEEADLSAATFYNVWPTKAHMFKEVFRHYVLEASMRADGDPTVSDSLTAYFNRLRRQLIGRSNLVRAMLIARLSSPPPMVETTNWLRYGDSSGDIVMDLCYVVFQIVVAEANVQLWGDDGDLTDDAYAIDKGVTAAVLIALDSAAVGPSGGLDGEELADFVREFVPDQPAPHNSSWEDDGVWRDSAMDDDDARWGSPVQNDIF